MPLQLLEGWQRSAPIGCRCRGARAHTEPLSDVLFTREALFTICYTGQVQGCGRSDLAVTRNLKHKL